MVYVDDFKMSGPTEGLKACWAMLQKEITMDTPTRVDSTGEVFLGCRHKVSNIVLADGTPARTVEYDMKGLFSQCVDMYCELSRLDRASLRKAGTPFLPEDHKESPAARPQDGAHMVERTWCKHTFNAPLLEASGNPQAGSAVPPVAQGYANGGDKHPGAQGCSDGWNSHLLAQGCLVHDVGPVVGGEADISHPVGGVLLANPNTSVQPRLVCLTNA